MAQTLGELIAEQTALGREVEFRHGATGTQAVDLVVYWQGKRYRFGCNLLREGLTDSIVAANLLKKIEQANRLVEGKGTIVSRKSTREYLERSQ